MSGDTGGWHYANPNTVPGALQRGLGRGAHQVASTSDASDLVTACLRRDYRWDRQVDERDVYLARLVRDLRMPIAPVITRLYEAPPRDSDDENAFTVALGVLEALGRADVDEAVEGVRRYVRHGARELRRRPPAPEFLDLAEDLADRSTAGHVHGVITKLGALALPAARRWAGTAGHPLTWTGLRLMAAHGDATDVPALVAGLDWLDARPDDRCGYDELAGGLARIGGPSAATTLQRLHRLWFSPHSYERASCLRAPATLDPAGAQRKIIEGLWGLRGRRPATGRAANAAGRSDPPTAAIPARRPHGDG
ncbi:MULTISPECIES: hypothetical protein [Catenuloplanes]|uniref:Uncharacterized protein n=1 Tax=Catenuloplanes niger TaxID=587534 RepID=A0AAE3ZKJ7_9ACTN|nr:hypothetical protein [Catenuloplanes niger]MDR7319868.1 hypothetical protein [Catenuloplanes niger]